MTSSHAEFTMLVQCLIEAVRKAKPQVKQAKISIVSNDATENIHLNVILGSGQVEYMEAINTALVEYGLPLLDDPSGPWISNVSSINLHGVTSISHGYGLNRNDVSIDHIIAAMTSWVERLKTCQINAER